MGVCSLARVLALSLCWCLIGFSDVAHAIEGSSPHLGLREDLLTATPGDEDFALFTESTSATLWVDRTNDWRGVGYAVLDLQADIRRVDRWGVIVPLYYNAQISQPPVIADHVVIIGTVGKSNLVDGLIATNARAASVAAELVGKRESFAIFVLENPIPGVEKALVILGSEKRGTIYGVYELSEQLGVSPWYYWADIPTTHRTEAFVEASPPDGAVAYFSGEPHVKYRGIFINDESPALDGWVTERFGSFNSMFYGLVFELLLRLRANFLWPAMWPGHSFSRDDPFNPLLADDYGIVISTSHHEPMMRHHDDWTENRRMYGNGTWSYLRNREGILQYWREGIQTFDNFETITTMGMRGDGDGGLSENTIEVMQEIIGVQRDMIEEIRGVPAETVPQAFVLYKEMQGFFTDPEGVDLPDDVTIVWANDNYGNIRRVGKTGYDLTTRKGGLGIYYHLQYYGRPRAYNWINTNALPKIAEQMGSALEWGVDTIWVANVGDLKFYEPPMEYWIRSAWDPERWMLGADDTIQDFLVTWATRDFKGADKAEEAAALYRTYTKYTGLRKPELVEAETFSPTAYREAYRVLDMWTELEDRVDAFYESFDEENRDQVYQLLVHPIKAIGAVNQLFVYGTLSFFYAAQRRVSANKMADEARRWYQVDADLTTFWDTELLDGKWRSFNSQPHIGYDAWTLPHQRMPAVGEYVPQPDEVPTVGVAPEGSVDALFGGETGELPPLYSIGTFTSRYIDVFRSGPLDAVAKFEFEATASSPAVLLTPSSGDVFDDDARVEVSVPDWGQLPANAVTTVEITITTFTADVVENILVTIDLHNGVQTANRGVSTDTVLDWIERVFSRFTGRTFGASKGQGRLGHRSSHNREHNLLQDAPLAFVDVEGYVAIEAAGADRVIDTPDVKWRYFEDLGRGPGAYTTHTSRFPPRVPSNPTENRPSLEFDVLLGRGGDVVVTLVVNPTLNFVDSEFLTVGVAFKGQSPQVVPFTMKANEHDLVWQKGVSDNIRRIVTTHTLSGAGFHTLVVHAVDAGLVLQRVEIDTGGLLESYLGPPQSPRGSALPVQ